MNWRNNFVIAAAFLLFACTEYPGTGPGGAAVGSIESGLLCGGADAGVGPIHCDDTCECPTGQVCTLDWNQGILYQVEAIGEAASFGHCVSPAISPGVFDDLAIQQDLDTLKLLAGSPSWTINGSGIPYSFPDRAELRFSTPLSIEFRVILDGRGAQILIPNDSDGIVLESGATLSTLRDFSMLAYSVTQSNSGIGIDVKANSVRLQNIRVSGMGTGIRALGTGDNNVNTQRWRDLVVTSSDHYGVFIDGRDANGMLLDGLSITGTTGVGLYEGGYLGNAAIGTHLEGNTIGLKTDTQGASWSTFVGTYIEGSDEIEYSDKSDNMTTIGGQLASRSSVVGARVGGTNSRMVFTSRVADPSNPEDTHQVRVHIPDLRAGTASMQDVAALQFFYELTDCDPALTCTADSQCTGTADNCVGGLCCLVDNFPQWHIARNMSATYPIDQWDLRTGPVTSIDRSAISWSSADIGGNSISAQISRDDVCDYVATCGP